MLREVAMRMNASIRESDIAARLGGDEFVILLEVLTSFDDISNVANKVSRVLAGEYRIDGIGIKSAASIGIATYPQDGKNIQTLMKNADRAMYHAKQRQRGSIQFFHEELNAEQMEHRQFQQEFELAIANMEFVLHYQPRMDVRTGAINAIEVFLRWQHPRLGLIGADRILQTSPDKNLLLALNEWTIATACAQWKKWREKEQLHSGIPLIINLEVIHLCSELIDLVISAGEIHDMPVSSLQVHVADALLFPELESSIGILELLRNAGIVMGINGFGIGYSSLTALRKCSPGFLKIHASLGRVIGSEADVALLAGILKLAQAMSVRVVVDGVDSMECLNTLHGLGFEEFQGALFCEPVDASVLPERLHTAFECVAA